MGKQIKFYLINIKFSVKKKQKRKNKTKHCKTWDSGLETVIKTKAWYQKARNDSLILSSSKKVTLGVDQSIRFGITKRLIKFQVS